MPTGRSSVGVAIASWSEKKEWAHVEHDVFALCHTRAKNRAIADLVGGGEVSAEELIPSEGHSESRAAQAAKTSSTSGPMPQGDSEDAWTPRVPVTKDVVTTQGIKQIPLIQGTTALGMMNVLEDGSEASIVPERPIPVDIGPVKSFLLQRVLEPVAAKDPQFRYRLVTSEDGNLQAIIVKGKLGEHHIKELSNAGQWSFRRAMEKQPQPS
jgi:hypothetical protein